MRSPASAQAALTYTVRLIQKGLTLLKLLAQVRSVFGGATISQYDYENDALGRRTEIARSGTAMSETRTDAYGYNDRNELTNAVKNATLDEYAYQYDDIGNRLTSTELDAGGPSFVSAEYTANNLNQYTSISNSVPPRETFTPAYDLDGNQTLVRTSTGIWSVTYNGENRPVQWSSGPTNIVMSFDRMGRRVEYVETVGTTTNVHHRFVYDGYLCVKRLNAASGNANDLSFTWDPLEKVATRLLMVAKTSKYRMYVTHDGNKNVSELVFFGGVSGIAAHYEYAPFGAVTVSTKNTSVYGYDFRTYNPFRFSSEYADDTLGLVYYNYRHYNPVDGRWTSRDPYVNDTSLCLGECVDELYNEYTYVNNDSVRLADKAGLFDYLCYCPQRSVIEVGGLAGSMINGQKCDASRIGSRETISISSRCQTGGLLGFDCIHRYCASRRCELTMKYECKVIRDMPLRVYSWVLIYSDISGCHS